MAETTYGQFKQAHGGASISMPAEPGERARLIAFIGTVADTMGLPSVIDPNSAESTARNFFDAVADARERARRATVPDTVDVPFPDTALDTVIDTGAEIIPAQKADDSDMPVVRPIRQTLTPLATVTDDPRVSAPLTSTSFSTIRDTGGEPIPQAVKAEPDSKSLWPLIIAAIALMGNF